MTTAVLEFEVKEDLDRLLKIAKIAGIYTKKRKLNKKILDKFIVTMYNSSRLI